MTDSAMEKELDGDSSYKRGEVLEIINSVIDKVRPTGESASDTLYDELKDLKMTIEAARRELAGQRPSDIQGKHIPTAKDELDEIIMATEEASGSIMDACEAIQKNFDKMDPAVSEDVGNAVTKIFETCSFQDITGQRIRKVITALHAIDEKVGSILGILSSEMPEDETEDETEALDGRDPGEILDGPQNADEAISQDEIDKLLAAFD